MQRYPCAPEAASVPMSAFTRQLHIHAGPQFIDVAPPSVPQSDEESNDAMPLQAAAISVARPAFSGSEPLLITGQLGGGLTVTSLGSTKPMPHFAAKVSVAVSTGSGGSQNGQDVEDAPDKKKKSRYCKAKRDHYRKLVEQLVQEARVKPDAFSLDTVKLPKAIAADAESKDKLLATVMRFARAEAL